MSSIFGFDQSNRLVHVSEVPRGLACNCRCVACDEPLVARQGSVREHHFAHSSGREPCDVSHESLLHRYAKQVIAQASGLVTPPHSDKIIGDLGLEFRSEFTSWMSLVDVEVEHAIGGIRPDLLGFTELGCQVAIEVAYSSFCDLVKISTFKELSLPALEIDLRAFTPEAFDPDAVKRTVLDDVASKRWLWPEQPVLPLDPFPLHFDVPVTPVAPPPPAVREPSARCPEEIVDVCGRWISIKTLPSGGIAVKVIRYDPEVVSMVRAIARSFWGRWWTKGHAWIIERQRADAARHELRGLSKTVGFVAVTREMRANLESHLCNGNGCQEGNPEREAPRLP